MMRLNHLLGPLQITCAHLQECSFGHSSGSPEHAEQTHAFLGRLKRNSSGMAWPEGHLGACAVGRSRQDILIATTHNCIEP